MQIRFIPSDSRSVQGKRNEVYKRYGNEWGIREQGGGNGNWLLTKKSDVLVDGISYRSFVLEHYGRTNLTENLADKFREDLMSGVIQLLENEEVYTERLKSPIEFGVSEVKQDFGNEEAHTEKLKKAIEFGE